MTRRGKLFVGAVLAATLVASGCGSTSGSAKGSAAKSNAVTTIPTNVPNIDSERKEVSISSCGAVSGGWAASGRATNPTKAAVTYDITIFFIKTGDIVETSANSKVSVPPGKNAAWSAGAKFDADPSTLCVLRGVG